MSKSIINHIQSDKDSVGLLHKREIRHIPTLSGVHSVRPTCTVYICHRPLTRAISVQTMGKVTSLFSYSLFRRKILQNIKQILYRTRISRLIEAPLLSFQKAMRDFMFFSFYPGKCYNTLK